MDMEVYSIINTLVTIFFGGGWFLHWRASRRKANKELQGQVKELDERMTNLDLQYKRDISRLGRRIDVLSPFLCGVAGCMHRKKVSLMENIDDNSFAASGDNENVEQ